jgi:hypothetical protein
MQGYTEIPLADLSPYAPDFRQALEAACKSPAFRTSPKSCEFLRHIIDRSLNGNTDELKERLIGMSLLGRDATYDTGSDAGVRVRANDVRKRLTAYNASEIHPGSFAFDLPSGSYVPRFFGQTTLSVEAEADVPVISGQTLRYETEMPLTLQRLAAPTVIALFLCVICLRWQIAQEHPFTTFWQHIFQGHDVRLYLPPAENRGRHQLVAIEEIQATAPLLNLAGQFHSQLSLTGDTAAREGEILISIGAPSQNKSSEGTIDLSPPDAGRLRVIDTANGRKIFDRTASKMYPAHGGPAALLTISNGPIRSIHIDGTDDASINSLVRLLCERDTFPEGLADGLADGTTNQVVFPMTQGAQPIIFRDSALARQTNIGETQ